jgi:DNA-binding transcriptional MerR regulator
VSYYSPGQVVEKTGFSVETLRYYERIGLIHEIGRTAGGRRRFTGTDVLWLLLLRCLRDTGMSIAEMLRFVELTRGGPETLSERIELFEAHDRRVEEQIERLREHQGHVRRKLRYYRSQRPMALPLPWTVDR